MKSLCILVVAAALLGGVAWAEEPLTLEAAISLARESNPVILRARVDQGGAEAAARAARAPIRNPELSLGAGARFTEQGPSADVQVGIEVPIDLGGSGRRVREREAAALDSARARLGAIETAVLVRVRVAFSEAVAAERRLALAEDEVALGREIERVAAKRHELGEVSILEPNSAALDRAAAEARSLAARGELVDALQRLRAVLGVAADGPLTLVGAPTPIWPQELPREADALVARALRSRADLVAARTGEDAAEAHVAATRAAGLAPVTLGAGWEREGDEANIVGGSVSFELPVQRGQVAVAHAEQAAGRAAVDADALALQVERDVLGALAAWGAAVERHQLATGEALTLAEESRRLVLRAYETGEEELLAVLAMQRQVIAARAAAIDAEQALQRAGARVEEALGEPVFLGSRAD